MAIDLDAIRNRLDSLQTKVTKTDNLWKPKPGKQQVRIVPYTHNESNPFIELFFHYGFGGKNLLSPQTFGEADPLVEFANQLKATGDRNDWNLSKQLTPKMRTYVPVLVRGEESEGVKFWGFGKTVYQELLSVIADPDYGDITDSMNGRDIKIERQTPAEAGNQYGKTTVRVSPKQTSITEDSTALKAMLDGQMDITELYTEPSYDDLKEALSNFLNPSDDSSESSTTTVTTNTSTTKPVAETVSNTADAFDNLFNS